MYTPEKKIVLVGGSPRRNGNSDLLLKTAADGILSEGVPCEIIFLRDYQYQPCLGCERCRRDKICTRLNDGMSLLYPKIINAQGLILASPVHHYNVTSWMKSFIDRMYCFYDFDNSRPRAWSSRLANQNRKAALFGVCEQADAKDMGFVIEAMQLPLEAFGYEMIGAQRTYGVFGKAELKKQTASLDEAFLLGAQLAKSIL